MVISEGVTSIGEDAFVYCKALRSIVIPNSIISIEDFAFSSCSYLTHVTIGSGVKSIGLGAFNRCYRLVEVVNNSSLMIEKGSTEYGDVCCYALVVYDRNYTFEETKISYNDDKYIVYKEGQEIWLLGYQGTETSLTIPNYITGISQYAFSECSITSVVIPGSVIFVGEYAFWGCSNLTSVYYKGTASEWSKISINPSNTKLTNATRYYYSETKPTTSGKYWHYVDGVPTKW